jgi:hypothetical protein
MDNSILININDDFNESLWWRSCGKWIFKNTMINFRLHKSYSNINLIGADIKLLE